MIVIIQNLLMVKYNYKYLQKKIQNYINKKDKYLVYINYKINFINVIWVFVNYKKMKVLL